MQITVNGNSQDIGEGCSIAKLLQQLELNPKQIAVEVNRELVPREEHANHMLCDGDELEVVTLVGGG